MATDPHARHDPLFSGIAITTPMNYMGFGSLGGFIEADGSVRGVPAGIYLLTNHHVLQYADPTHRDHNGDQRILQPFLPMDPQYGNEGENITPWYVIGTYTAGRLDASYDCAIAAVGNSRGYVNEVPKAPWNYGRRSFAAIGQAARRDRVYKFGAATRFTRGRVVDVDQNPGDRQHVIIVEGVDGGVWADHGDSGSLLFREEDHAVIGLNFSMSERMEDRHESGGSTVGYAYDITAQMAIFGSDEFYIAPCCSCWCW
jgi:hypothetical protein